MADLRFQDQRGRISLDVPHSWDTSFIGAENLDDKGRN